MIHRAPFGSLERFIAVLIEHTAGKFPIWLNPEQFIILPISDKFNDYANEVSSLLKNSDIRGLIDERSEKIGRKIRDAEVNKVPYMLIIGEQEMEAGKVAVRRQGEGDIGTFTIAEFAEIINKEIKEKLIEFN